MSYFCFKTNNTVQQHSSPMSTTFLQIQTYITSLQAQCPALAALPSTLRSLSVPDRKTVTDTARLGLLAVAILAMSVLQAIVQLFAQATLLIARYAVGTRLGSAVVTRGHAAYVAYSPYIAQALAKASPPTTVVATPLVTVEADNASQRTASQRKSTLGNNFISA